MFKINASKYINTGPNKKYLLKNIQLILPEKGLIFITGNKNSGKTTLINIIGALEKPSSGEVFFKGEKLEKANIIDNYRANSVGYVFQKYFYFKGTVRENLNQFNNIIQKNTNDELYLNLLKKVAFNGRLHDQMIYLPAGEAIKVNLASALLKNPDIIIADEITNGLSFDEQREIINILKEISKEKLVLVGLENDFSGKIADRIIRIEEGKISKDSSPLFKTNNKLRTEDKEVKKLNFKGILKGTLANIKTTASLTLIFIISAILFFTFFFTSRVLNEFDGPALILEIMNEHNVEYGDIYKVEINYSAKKVELSNQDVIKIKEDNPKLDYYKVLNIDVETFYPDALGIVEMPENERKIKFLYGDAPKETGEYFVTTTFATSLLRWTRLLGYNFNSIQDLIGYTIEDLGGLKLVGITEDALWDDHAYVKAGYLDSIYPYLKENNREYCNYLHVKMSNDYNVNYQVFSMYYGDFNYYIDPTKEYIITNTASSTVFPSVAVYYTMAEQDRILTYYLFIFPLILVFLIIPKTLKSNRRENWMKRTIGMKNKEFVFSLLLQFLLIFIIILSISTLFGIFRIKILENIYSYQMRRTFYEISFINILRLILLAFSLIFIASILPILKISQSYPQDILKLPQRKQKPGEYYFDIRYND